MYFCVVIKNIKVMQTKIYIAKRSCGRGLCVVAANSPEEAFGVMVREDDCLKYSYNVSDFEEVLNAVYYGAPCLISEDSKD